VVNGDHPAAAGRCQVPQHFDGSNLPSLPYSSLIVGMLSRFGRREKAISGSQNLVVSFLLALAVVDSVTCICTRPHGLTCEITMSCPVKLSSALLNSHLFGPLMRSAPNRLRLY
jgi:hypothetical protein